MQMSVGRSVCLSVEVIMQIFSLSRQCSIYNLLIDLSNDADQLLMKK